MCLRTAYQLLCNHLTDQKLEFLCQSILYFLEKKSICLLQKNQLLHPKTGELKNIPLLISIGIKYLKNTITNFE